MLNDGPAPTIRGFPEFSTPPLLGEVPPRCPPYIEVESADHLLPYLEVVANRPYNQGLHACWDLQPGERVLLRVDNWHDEMVVDACKKILEKYNCKYEIMRVDKGPIPQWVGADEVEYYLNRTKELADWMDQWDKIAKDQTTTPRTSAAMANLAESIQGLVTHMRSEQQMLRDFVETQAGEQRELRQVLDRLAGSLDDKRKEP